MAKAVKKSVRIVDCWNTVGVWGHADKKCEELEKHIHCRNCPVFAEIGHVVFERIAPSGYLSQWRKEISAKAVREEERTKSVLIFRVFNEWFGLPAKVLNEVANERTMHRIPRNTNRYISGVVNINGEISICYSLKELLGISSDAGMRNENKGSQEKPRRLIVIYLADKCYVFPVDEVKGLRWYADSDLLPLPSTLNTENSHLLLGSIRQEGQQAAIFNMHKFQEKLEGIVI
jgi:chemotaxis-related protein WspD